MAAVLYWLTLGSNQQNGGIVMLDKATVIKTGEQYAKAVTGAFSPQAILLYGSHAKGNASDESDIDVAVIFNNFTGDWLEASSKLNCCSDLA